MGRPCRVWVEHGLYHVFSRGSNRGRVVADEEDYAGWERILLDVAGTSDVKVHAWALMPNHWHAMLRVTASGPSAFMQRVNHRHALCFDRRWGNVGHVWQHRFGAVLQESEPQYLWTLRYIARNAVETGLCSSPAAWRWSSYAATAGLRRAPGVLCVSDVLRSFDDDPEIAAARFRAFVVSD